MSSITSLISTGGGGGTPVNGIAQLYLDGALSYTDESGQIWLKTGNIIAKDTVTYPDATFGLNLAGATFLTSFSVSAQELNPKGLAFNNDGTKMYVIGRSGNDVNEYALSTAFDVSSASFTATFPFTGTGLDTIGAIAFNNDGTNMFIVSAGSIKRVWQLPLSTAFDITTTGTQTGLFSLGTEDTAPTGIAFSNDGTRMFLTGNTNDSVYQYNLTTAFTPTTGVFAKSFSVAAQQSSPQGIAFSNDGTRMYVVNFNGVIQEYILGLPFDIGEVSVGASFSVAAQDTGATDIRFNNDGTKLYIVGQTNDAVYEYSVPEAMGLTANTGTYDYLKLK